MNKKELLGMLVATKYIQGLHTGEEPVDIIAAAAKTKALLSLFGGSVASNDFRHGGMAVAGEVMAE